LPVPAVRVSSRSVLVAPDTALAGDGAAGSGCTRGCRRTTRNHLDRQVARLAAWPRRPASPVARVKAEVGSGTNGARSKARRLLADPAFTLWWWSTATGSAG